MKSQSGPLLLSDEFSPRYRLAPTGGACAWCGDVCLAILTWIVAPVILAGPTFAQTVQPSPVPVVSKSTCPETMSDVDRVACWVSLAPEPAPAGPKPQPPLLRGSDGAMIIGPNSTR